LHQFVVAFHRSDESGPGNLHFVGQRLERVGLNNDAFAFEMIIGFVVPQRRFDHFFADGAVHFVFILVPVGIPDGPFPGARLRDVLIGGVPERRVFVRVAFAQQIHVQKGLAREVYDAVSEAARNCGKTVPEHGAVRLLLYAADPHPHENAVSRIAAFRVAVAGDLEAAGRVLFKHFPVIDVASRTEDNAPGGIYLDVAVASLGHKAGYLAFVVFPDQLDGRRFIENLHALCLDVFFQHAAQGEIPAGQELNGGGKFRVGPVGLVVRIHVILDAGGVGHIEDFVHDAAALVQVELDQAGVGLIGAEAHHLGHDLVFGNDNFLRLVQAVVHRRIPAPVECKGLSFFQENDFGSFVGGGVSGAQAGQPRAQNGDVNRFFCLDLACGNGRRRCVEGEFFAVGGRHALGRRGGLRHFGNASGEAGQQSRGSDRQGSFQEIAPPLVECFGTCFLLLFVADYFIFCHKKLLSEELSFATPQQEACFVDNRKLFSDNRAIIIAE